eukprot:m.140230 g.140230  ORF g.140230 m.140230 type:complete len:165 (-) comp30106_c12_seq1:198-692(-)
MKGGEKIDIDVFATFIRGEEDESLVSQYIQEYFGDSSRVRSFTRKFVDQRSKISSGHASAAGWESAKPGIKATPQQPHHQPQQPHQHQLQQQQQQLQQLINSGDNDDQEGDNTGDGFAQVGKGGKKKKKKGRGLKLDPAMLNYNVASSGGANRGGTIENAWQKR